MAIDAAPRGRFKALLLVLTLFVGLTGCATGPLVGLVYTNVKLPLTLDLKATPVPLRPPDSDRIIEIKEPFTGLGMYARVSANAIGEIARKHGVATLYFADQEVFSILGIWKTNRVFLYGEASGGPEAHTDRTRAP
jgi:hypothetical protein